jgi:hypothetical protein
VDRRFIPPAYHAAHLAPTRASDNPARVSYRIDSEDRLVYADGAFHRFADAAGVPDLAERWYGRSIWHCIGDDELRAVFVALVARARSGRTVRVDTRCDSPSLARSVAMEIAPLPDDGVEFRCRLGRARLMTPALPSGSELLRVCAWCYRADRGGWRDIEDVVADEHLLERPTVPVVTHGICDGCLAEAAAQLDPAPA